MVNHRDIPTVGPLPFASHNRTSISSPPWFYREGISNVYIDHNHNLSKAKNRAEPRRSRRMFDNNRLDYEPFPLGFVEALDQKHGEQVSRTRGTNRHSLTRLMIMKKKKDKCEENQPRKHLCHILSKAVRLLHRI
jgi:hypothetical protein